MTTTVMARKYVTGQEALLKDTKWVGGYRSGATEGGFGSVSFWGKLDGHQRLVDVREPRICVFAHRLIDEM